VAVEQVRHRHVGGQRKGRIAGFRWQHRAKPQGIAPLRRALHFLLRRIDAGRPASLFGRRDARGDVREAIGQILIPHRIVSQLGAALNDRARDGIDPHRTIGCNTRGEHHRGARPIGQQAGHPFGQDGRIETGLAIGQIRGDTPPPCLLVDGVVIANEPRHVGNGIVQQEVRPGPLDREGLIQIGRAGGVERDEIAPRPVGMIGRHAPRGPFGCGEHIGRKTVRHAELGPDGRKSFTQQAIRITNGSHPASAKPPLPTCQAMPQWAR